MYNEYFNLNQSPFSLTPDTDFFCDLSCHTEALDVVLYSLKEGDGFVKIVGEVGVGKTLLCRKMVSMLDDSFIACYFPNPDLTPDSFREALAIELGINTSEYQNQHALTLKIQDCLISAQKKGKKVVIIVDEAQAMNDQTLETLRLLTNLETGKKRLLQVVLVGQPELDERLSRNHLRQLKQRITVSHYLNPLDLDDVGAYITRRLIAAGHRHGAIFSDKAKKYLIKKSHGIPRILNILCHKSLLVAYNKNDKNIELEHVKKAIYDSKDILNTITLSKSLTIWKGLYFVEAITLVCIIASICYLLFW